jgi:hypothetical protein
MSTEEFELTALQAAKLSPAAEHTVGRLVDLAGLSRAEVLAEVLAQVNATGHFRVPRRWVLAMKETAAARHSSPIDEELAVMVDRAARCRRVLRILRDGDS